MVRVYTTRTTRLSTPPWTQVASTLPPMMRGPDADVRSSDLCTVSCHTPAARAAAGAKRQLDLTSHNYKTQATPSTNTGSLTQRHPHSDCACARIMCLTQGVLSLPQQSPVALYHVPPPATSCSPLSSMLHRIAFWGAFSILPTCTTRALWRRLSEPRSQPRSCDRGMRGMHHSDEAPLKHRSALPTHPWPLPTHHAAHVRVPLGDTCRCRRRGAPDASHVYARVCPS